MDDRTTVLRTHDFQCFLYHEEGSGEVYAHDLPRGRNRILRDGYTGPKQTGTVDKHIEFSELLHRRLDDRFRRSRVAYITNATMRLPPGRANISDCLIEIGIAARANKHASFLARVGGRNRLADSAAAASDKRDFST